MPAPIRVVLRVVVVGAVVTLGLVGCSDDKKTGTPATTTTAVERGSGGKHNKANTLSIDTKEYAFALADALADAQAALQSEDERRSAPCSPPSSTRRARS